ncbi:chemotaxis protein CheB [Capillimicrobium parvum]|uniref:protein-glutamate methylesterase n=1 Tax=Capillimicrobium parvum TaxID=2884022 RepID=A0A9E6Y1B5_9ACTN|nr:chemotaxis protein CheB [Capillimicrobium parvum]UGS37611.1 Protein-glutamate methylesterase/protein-glutamine glutaminase [Capillimicrobium parvum]
MVDLVVIGASWGGLRALRAVLAPLTPDFPAPILIVQHRSDEESALAELLARTCALTVREAEDKDRLQAGTVLLAPHGYHLLVEGDEAILSVDDPVRFSRPSIDVLLESAAEHGDRAVGVVLTGANADGAAGLAAIRRRGGIAIVQDPQSAERPQMPRAALAAVPDAQVRPLEQIGPELMRICAPSTARPGAA